MGGVWKDGEFVLASTLGARAKKPAPPEPLRVGALTDERIKQIGQTLGKSIRGECNYTSWPGMGYTTDSAGEFTVPQFPAVGYEFARAIEREVLATQPTSAAAASKVDPTGMESDLQGSGAAAPATNSFVQPVPDKCDRITWRGHYYQLPLEASAAATLTDEQAKAAVQELGSILARQHAVFLSRESVHDLLSSALAATTPGGKQ